MNFDTIFDNKVYKSHLQTDLQKLSPGIYSALISLNEALLFLDNNLIIAFLNEKANEIIKKTCGKFFEIGESFLSLLQNEEQINLKKHLEEVLTGKKVQYELKIINDGQPLWLKYSFTPLQQAQDINGICVVLKDITLIKELDEKNRKRRIEEDTHFQSKLLFETFMESTPLTAWITDIKGVMHYLNPTFRKAYNLPLDNLSRNMDQIFPKDLVKEYTENNLLTIKSGHTREMVERTVKPDGTMAIYKVFKFPMVIAGETMIGGWSMEITEETKLQEQLTSSIERYSYVNEATSDAIYDWDVNTNILYRGKGFAILFGYHDPYVPLEFRFNRIHPDDVAGVKKIYIDSIENPALRRWKTKYRLKDAKDIYKNVVDKAFIVRENGKVVRVIGAIQDITEYNQLQEKLVLQEESKKRAIVRSIIETQEKERRQLSVELHDNVNQILSSCKLMLEVAKENKEKAPLLTEKSYQSIQLAIAEIRKISHDLNPSSVEDFGLKEALKEMIEKLNLSGKINIVFKFTGSIKSLYKSEDKIAVYRIVQEQLNNILKHANANNVSVTVHIKALQIQLKIEDDGRGFNLKKNHKGLGFRNIYHRVEYYRGNINIETGINKGCKMSIMLNISPNY
jgi:PAS domain S-box-containing protein